MNSQFRTALSIIFAGVWINASEFLRNQVLLHEAWLEHYRSLQMTFPEDPLNGAIWGAWGFMYAGIICFIGRRFTLLQTSILAWVFGFAMMWLVIWNLGVLPLAILPVAVPLSLLESVVAALICRDRPAASGHL
jgi:hypothetical protein